jgi:hypothetical protein
MARRRHRVNARIHPEASTHRALEKLSAGFFDAAFDHAGINRRLAPFGVRQGNFRLSPRERFAFALVLLADVRLDDRNHAAIRLSDDMFVTARRFGKISGGPIRFEHPLGVAERDPLNRALIHFEAVVLPQLDPRLREGLIGGKIGDRPLQWPRTTTRNDFCAANERAHTLLFELVLRL